MIQFKHIENVSKSLPKMNKDFILKHRYRVFEEIPKRVELILLEALEFLKQSDVEYKYNGYTILNPDEKIEIMSKSGSNFPASLTIDKSKNNTKPLWEVHFNTIVLAKYSFVFNGNPVDIFVHIPFLRDHKSTYGGVSYYPDLPITEKCLHINKKENLLIIKVTRTPLKFWRIAPPLILDVEKKHKIYRDSIITARITKMKKNSKGIPIIIYHLIEGFYPTLKRYGFAEDELILTERFDPDDKAYKYYDLEVNMNGIKLENTIYLKVKLDAEDDIYKRRFISSFIYVLRSFNRPYRISDIIDPEAILWLLILGLNTYQNVELMHDDSIVIRFAKEVVLSNKTMLDSLTVRAFKSINIHTDDFNDFLYAVFRNFDQWYSEYNAADLYDKRISYISMYGNFEKQVNRTVYGISKRIKQKKEGYFKSLMYTDGTKPTWLFNSTGIFQANPQIFNSHLSMLFRRFISADSDESGGKIGKRVQTDFLYAHPSQLAVTSINTIPSSSPIISGSINPYIDIDEIGNIVVDPDIKEYVKKCFQDIINF